MARFVEGNVSREALPAVSRSVGQRSAVLFSCAGSTGSKPTMRLAEPHWKPTSMIRAMEVHASSPVKLRDCPEKRRPYAECTNFGLL